MSIRKNARSVSYQQHVDLRVESDKRPNQNYLIGTQFSIESTLYIPLEVLELLTGDHVFMGACGLTISEQSARHVNFTRPFCIQSYAMLIARPKELGRLYLFVAPFATDVSSPPL